MFDRVHVSYGVIIPKSTSSDFLKMYIKRKKKPFIETSPESRSQWVLKIL